MFISATDSLLMAQTDSIVNERLPVKARELEAHWDVDCDQTLKTTKQYLASPGVDSSEHVRLYRDAEKCAHIYNTPDTDYFKAEPDS